VTAHAAGRRYIKLPVAACLMRGPHLGLVVRGGAEHLRLLGGDGGVAVDEPREDAAQRLDAQAQRRDVQQQQVAHVAAQHAAAAGRAGREPHRAGAHVLMHAATLPHPSTTACAYARTSAHCAKSCT